MGPVSDLVEGSPDFELLEEREFILRRAGSSIADEQEYAIKHALTREVGSPITVTSSGVRVAATRAYAARSSASRAPRPTRSISHPIARATTSR